MKHLCPQDIDRLLQSNPGGPLQLEIVALRAERDRLAGLVREAVRLMPISSGPREWRVAAEAWFEKARAHAPAGRDQCLACLGTGWRLVYGPEAPEQEACQSCDGTGRRPDPREELIAEALEFLGHEEDDRCRCDNGNVHAHGRCRPCRVRDWLARAAALGKP